MYKNQLRSIRKKQKISQARLMGLTGVNQTRISFIENGYIKGTEKERSRLANALGVNTSDVFEVDQERVYTP
jgi:transcriptional regulator with XRE-family HTH domain